MFFDSPIGGSASNGVDYETLPTSVTFPANVRSVSFPVTPLQDHLIAELNETVTLALKDPPAPGYALGTPPSASVTIANAVPIVTITAADALATEPADNLTPPTDTGKFLMTRSLTNLTLPITVNFASPVGGTATNGVDYDSIGSPVTIPAGATDSAPIIVTPKYDTLVEGTETVLLALAAGTGYSFMSAGPAEVKIADVPPGSISGIKFEDMNGNGFKDAEDIGVAGWTIQLSGAMAKSTVTGANGEYRFDNLIPGTYRVREVPNEVQQAAWVQTTVNPGDIQLAAGQQHGPVNFGNFHLVTIEGQKFNDLNGDGRKDANEPGLNGWTITLALGKTRSPNASSTSSPAWGQAPIN